MSARLLALACAGAASALDLGATVLGAHAKLRDALRPAAECVDESFDLGGGGIGRVVGFEATDSDVAWCSALVDPSSAELQAWNGPSIEAPHLYARLGRVDDTIELEIDFRNRLDAGYNPEGEASGYPAPASRDAFAQAGLRKEYDGAFFDERARAWRDDVRASSAGDAASPWADVTVEGRRQQLAARICRGGSRRRRGRDANIPWRRTRGNAVETGARLRYGGDDAGTIGGPLALCVRFPGDTAGEEAAVAACDAAVERYLSWVSEPARSSWMRTRLIFARDTLVRQYRPAGESHLSFRNYGAVAPTPRGGRADAAGLSRRRRGAVGRRGAVAPTPRGLSRLCRGVDAVGRSFGERRSTSGTWCEPTARDSRRATATRASKWRWPRRAGWT